MTIYVMVHSHYDGTESKMHYTIIIVSGTGNLTYPDNV